MRTVIIVLAFLLFLVSSPAYCEGELHPEAEGKITIPLGKSYDSIKVKRVIDGDTILLSNGERVRYIGINT